jgi:putative transposase
MNGDLGTAAARGELVRLALRLIVEEALEGEVSDALGRERYERGEGEKAGYRNGYRPGKVKTAEGAVDYSAPQVRDTPEPFVSGVRAALSGRTRELERLAVELYARGLSTRFPHDARPRRIPPKHPSGAVTILPGRSGGGCLSVSS